MKVANKASLNIFFSNEKNEAKSLDDKNIEIDNNQLVECVNSYLGTSN